jgi:prepilin-type N-terminal cleavage/methylation domain-containing protein
VSPRQTSSRSLLVNERGFTMIELLIAISMGIVISLAAFSFLGFATSDVSRIDERVHIDQTARVTLENIVLELHSACVTPSVVPIIPGSTSESIKFISEAGTGSALSSVHEHEIIYEAAKGAVKGQLVEKTYLNTPPPTGKEAPEYSFPKTASSTKKLLIGVVQSESGGKPVPIFQYYRYYQASDTIPTGHTTIPYGELYPKALSKTELEKEVNVEKVVKVTVSYTLAPEGVEIATFNRDRPIPLEDSVVFRLAPAAESSSNLPCSPST